jgi:hypothetical protein
MDILRNPFPWSKLYRPLEKNGNPPGGSFRGHNFIPVAFSVREHEEYGMILLVNVAMP